MSQLQVTGEAKIRDIQGPVVANSGVITALDGAASQYVRGDGTLADFPTSTGGGSSVSYYLNSSVSQGTIGGVAYRELSKEPIIGAGTDITISANGYVASYITDANDPDVLSVPGGNFNCEFYFSVNNNTGNPTTYAELYKYDGTTFTLLGSSVAVPESLNQGTTIAPYYFAIPVATAALALTDRLAIRIYVSVDGRVVTLHTENSHLCQVVTTFSKGMVSLNNLTDQSQFITTGTSGTDFNIVSIGDTHTFNIPSASASNRGLITTGGQTIAGSKTFNNAINAESGVLLKNGFTTYSNSYTSLGGNIGNLIISGSISSTPFDNELAFTPSTSNIYTFPNASGTLALTSNLSSYVPYTGATGNVDLGTFNLSTLGTLQSKYVYIIGNGTNSGFLSFSQYATPDLSGTHTNSIYTTSNNKVNFRFWQSGLSWKNFNFDVTSLTAGSDRTYTMPDASGTIALTSNIPSVSGTSTYIPVFTGTNSLGNSQIWNNGGIIGMGTNYSNPAFYVVASSGDTLTQGKLAINTTSFSGTSVLQVNGAATLTGNLTGTTAAFSSFVNAFSFTAIGGTSNAGQISLKHTGAISVGDGYVTIAADSSNTLGIYFFNSFSAKFSISALTNNRTYTLPDGTGTLALTSNLSAYLPLTGGTLTGALSGTSATFSSTITANGNITASLSSPTFLATDGTNNSYFATATSNNGYANGTLAGDAVIRGTSGISLSSNGGSSTALRIASTGAATFSSSVSVGTAINAPGSAFNSIFNVNGANLGGTTGNTAKIANLGFDAGGNHAGLGITAYRQSTGTNWTTAGIKFTYDVDNSTAIYDNMLCFFGGNVGIGTSSPASPSSFAKTMTIYDSSSASYSFNVADTYKGEIGISSGGGWLSTYTNDPFRFLTNNTERMRITSGGELYWNLTGASGGSLNGGGVLFRNNSGKYIQISTGLTTDNGLIYFYKSDGAGSVTNTGSITTSGNSTAYNTTSDYRIKEDFKDVNGLEKISAIKVYDFKFKGIDNRMDGVIAHELAEVLPYAVSGEKDAVDDNGDIKPQAVDYSKIVPVNTKAIQELYQLVLIQDAKIEELKALINK